MADVKDVPPGHGAPEPIMIQSGAKGMSSRIGQIMSPIGQVMPGRWPQLPTAIKTYSKQEALALYTRHKTVLQSIFAGLDPATRSFPNTAAKWWLFHLYDPFGEINMCYQMSDAIWKNVDNWLKTSGWLGILRQ